MTMYANIFYDRNNTSYYADFGSGGDCAKFNGEVQIIGPTGTTHLNYNNDGGYNYFRAYANYFDQNQTYIRDCRAYIFYDWNNTGYYINPGNRSNFYEVIWVGARTRAGRGGSGSNWFNIEWRNPRMYGWIDWTQIGVMARISDYRLKQNVTPISNDAIDRIMQLEPIEYEWNDYSKTNEDGSTTTLSEYDGQRREGFIAHDLQAVIPSAVEGVKDDPNSLQSIDFDGIGAVMVKAIQEIKVRMDSLEERVNNLE